MENDKPSLGEMSGDGKDIFAEMRELLVDVVDFDDSREAIYSRVDGE